MQKQTTTTKTTVIRPGQSKQNKKNKNRNTPRSVTINKLRARPGIPRSGISMLSPCAQKFAFAVVDPSDPRGFGACVPAWPARASQKIHIQFRATVTIGTAGVGKVYLLPSLASDGPCMYVTNSTYSKAMTDASDLNSTDIAMFNAITCPGLPYVSAGFLGTTTAGAGAIGRIISAKASIQYVSAVSAMAGTIATYVDPNHDNLTSLTGNQITSYPTASVERISAKTTNIVVSAITPEELEYLNYDPDFPLASTYVYPLNGGQLRDAGSLGVGLNAAVAIAVVILQGTAGHQFNVVYSQACEYIGRDTQASWTPNTADDRGYKAVLTAASKISESAPVNQFKNPETLMNQALNAAINAETQSPGILARAGSAAVSGLKYAYARTTNGGLREASGALITGY